jgi:hypothetical protein
MRTISTIGKKRRESLILRAFEKGRAGLPQASQGKI